MTHGVTLTWISSHLGVPERTVRSWIYKDPTIPRPGRGNPLYSRSVVDRLRMIQTGYQTWPRGPFENILDWIDRENHDED